MRPHFSNQRIPKIDRSLMQLMCLQVVGKTKTLITLPVIVEAAADGSSTARRRSVDLGSGGMIVSYENHGYSTDDEKSGRLSQSHSDVEAV